MRMRLENYRPKPSCESETRQNVVDERGKVEKKGRKRAAK
jgi:hypothetical protein